MQLARNVFPDRIPRARADPRPQAARGARGLRDRAPVRQGRDPRAVPEPHLLRQRRARSRGGGAPLLRHLRGQADLAARPRSWPPCIRGPSHYDPRRHPDRARERRDLVLDPDGAAGAGGLRRRRRPREPCPSACVRRRAPSATADAGLAPYFAEEVRRQLEDRFGERVYDETLSVDHHPRRRRCSARRRRSWPASCAPWRRAPRTLQRPALLRLQHVQRKRHAVPARRGGRARGRHRRRAGLGRRPRLPAVPLRPREVVAAPGRQRVQAVRLRGGAGQGALPQRAAQRRAHPGPTRPQSACGSRRTSTRSTTAK